MGETKKPVARRNTIRVRDLIADIAGEVWRGKYLLDIKFRNGRWEVLVPGAHDDFWYEAYDDEPGFKGTGISFRKAGYGPPR